MCRWVGSLKDRVCLCRNELQWENAETPAGMWIFTESFSCWKLHSTIYLDVNLIMTSVFSTKAPLSCQSLLSWGRTNKLCCWGFLWKSAIFSLADLYSPPEKSAAFISCWMSSAALIQVTSSVFVLGCSPATGCRMMHRGALLMWNVVWAAALRFILPEEQHHLKAASLSNSLLPPDRSLITTTAHSTSAPDAFHAVW